MLDVANLPHDFCIGCYVPTYLWDNGGPPHGFTHFIAAIKAFSIVDELEAEQAIEDAIRLLSENICGFDAVAVVPSHSKGDNSQAGIFRIARGLAIRSNGKIVDATSCLVRTQTVEKLAKGGDRSKAIHLNSIELRYPHFVYGKNVLLIDDVRCSGNSLNACQQILEQANPTKVHSLALAQSINDNMDDPDLTYAHIESGIHQAYQQQHQGLEHDEESEIYALNQIQNFAQ